MTSRVALVTGVSRGIGAAIAETLLARGFRVYGCATGTDFPHGVVGYRADVSSPGDVTRMFADFGGRETRLDLLVNNAGVLGPRVSIEETALDEWRRVFAVNADGPFLVTRAALPFLRAASGRVVNVSSSVGRRGRGGWGAYACSKHALEGLTDVLADELRSDGVVVVSVNPGGTATAMRADAFPDEDPATLPTAAQIAAVMVERTLELTVADTGARLDCRDLI